MKRSNTMKILRHFILWAALFGGFCLLFYFFREETEPVLPYTAETEVITLLSGEETISLPLRDYLIGAVAGEMPASFGSEALKAQAVAIRTYLMASKRHENADICGDSRCCLAYANICRLQELWGKDYEENLARISHAVDSTAGEYLTYMDEPIQAVFHASSGGMTEASAAIWTPLPYLVSVSSPESVETLSNLVSTVSLSPEELSSALGLKPSTPPEEWLQSTRTHESGRVKGLLLCGKAFTGEHIRSIFSLRSTNFDLMWTGSEFLFTVTGHGHGVGMSQYGAKLLAEQGYTYDEILAHYYPGTELHR